MTTIKSSLKIDEHFKLRDEYNRNLLKKLKAQGANIKKGGGEKSISKLHAKGKLHARERIDLLIDEGSKFMELGLFAAHGMYKEYGGAPAAGTVFGIGKIHGRNCVIVANDATVKAGAWFPVTGKKKSSRSGDCNGEQTPDYLPG